LCDERIGQDSSAHPRSPARLAGLSQFH
jgi:hypothetical protein